MKLGLFILSVVLCCATGLFAADSAKFTLNTRYANFMIEELKSDYCEGPYNASLSRKAYFLSEKALENHPSVKFTAIAGSREIVSYVFFINGVPQGTAKSDNTFNLSLVTLQEGDTLSVRGYDLNGYATPPCRANFDVVPKPKFVYFTKFENGMYTIPSLSKSGETAMASYSGRKGYFPNLGYNDKAEVGLTPNIGASANFNVVGGASVLSFWAGEDASIDKKTQNRNEHGQFAPGYGKVMGVDIQARLKGEWHRKWQKESNGNYTHKTTDLEGSGGLRLSASTQEFRPPALLGLGYLQGKFALDTEIKAAYEPAKENSENIFGPLKLSVKCEPSLSLIGGIGWENVHAEATGEGRVPIEYEGGFTSVKLKGTFDANIRAYLYYDKEENKGIGIDKNFKLFSGELELYPEEKSVVAKSAAFEETNGEGVLQSSKFQPLPERRRSPRIFTAMPSKKAAGASEHIIMADAPVEKFSEIDSDAAGCRWVATVDDSDRSDMNVAKIALFRAQNGELATEAVWDSGFNDFEPNLARLSSNELVVAWSRASRAWSDGEPFADALCTLDAAVAVRHANGTWTRKVLSSAGDAAYDHSLSLAADGNGHAVVVWVSNARGSLVASAESHDHLMYSVYRNGAWSPAAVLVADAGRVSSGALACRGDDFVYVYAADETFSESDFSVLELYQVACRGGTLGAKMRLTDDDKEDCAPDVAYDGDGNAVLAWKRDDAVVSASSRDGYASVQTLRAVVERGAISSPEFVKDSVGTLAGLKILAMPTNRPSDSIEVMYAPYAADGSWEGFVALTDNDVSEEYARAAVGGDGNIHVVYLESAKVESDEDFTRYGTMKEVVCSPGCDYAINDAYLAFEDEITLGTNANIAVTLENRGLLIPSPDAFPWLRVYRGGSLVGEVAVTNLPPIGQSVEIAVPWMVAMATTNADFVVRFDAEGVIGDVRRENNEYAFADFNTDLMVAAVRTDLCGGDYTITAEIANDGLVYSPENMNVEFRIESPDGRLLGQDTIGRVGYGSDLRYCASIAVGADTLNLTSEYTRVYVIVNPEKSCEEASYANNTGIGDLIMMVDSDGDGLPDAEETAIGSNPGNADTDGDGITDFDEVRTYGSSPVKRSYRIAFEAGENGTFRTGESTAYAVADENTSPRPVSVTPRAGYRFAGWEEDLLPASAATTYHAKYEESVYYVDAATGSDENSGESAQEAWKTLQHAVDSVSEGRRVCVADGVYEPFVCDNRLITIESVNGPQHAIIDGGGTNRCATLGASAGQTNTVLRGFTLRNGNASGSAVINFKGGGGGVCCGTVEGCHIYGNTAASGGGAYESHLENCVIARNKVELAGGGIYNSVADHCTICGNEAGGSGGGTYIGTLSNSIVSKNVVGGSESNWSYGTFYSCCTTPNCGSNPIVGDPLLVDGWNGDARLRVGSSCIVDGVQVCGAYLGEPLEGVGVSVGVQGAGSASSSVTLVTSGGSATIEAVETVRPFLYWNINGEQVTNQVYTLTNITADIRAIAVFGTFDWYVDAEYGDDANDGHDWGAAKRTLQSAVDAAVDDETIYVEAGTYEPIATDNKRIRIESMNGAEMTFIDGGGTNRCATLGSVSVHTNSALVGFTLLNGCAPESGSSAYGGGSCYGTLECCVISNCTASGYYAYGGGAYYGHLNNCLVAYNCATSSSYGAYGGGTYYSALRSCTVARNCSVGASGAYAGGTYGGNYAAYNTVIWDNEVRASNSTNAYYRNTYYQYLYYCCTDETADRRYTGTITNDPQFVDADAGNFHLKVGSPCLDAGYDRYVRGDMDLDWDDRIQGASVDMGCYEGAEFVAPPGQVAGLVAVRGVLKWDAMTDAEGYMIYRSTRRAPASAKYIGASDTNSYADETAVDGTTYYYWVQAFNTLGMGTRSEGVENTWPIPLSITTSALPEATEMGAYSARLEVTGGVAPYSWSCLGAGYSVTTNTTSTFAETGTAQGWHADDDCWELELPFDFPFYGNRYRTVYVNSNGTITFDRFFANYDYSHEDFTNHVMVAALWYDLTTSNGGDIYVSTAADSVMIRWGCQYLSNGDSVSASVTLYADGTVCLSYGSGNASGGFVGVSAGDGESFVIIDNSSASRDNAPDIVLRGSALATGMSLSEEGEITGVPTEAGTNTFTVTVTDAAGDTAERELSLAVAENPNHRPVIDGALPTTNVYVKVGDSATFAVMAHDPEDEPLEYAWYLDGAEADCEGAQFIFAATLEGVGAHTLECVVSDGLWTDKVRHQWSFRVVRDWFVDAAADEGTGDGSSAVSALCSISEAIQQAEDGDTIYVAPGIYDEYIEFNSGHLLSVIATGGAQHTFLRDDIRGAEGEERGHAQTVVQSSLTGFTMQGCYVSAVTLKDCILTGDETDVYPSETYGCRLFDCAVTGNTCDDPPIYESELTRCTVAGNVVGDYGAVSDSDVFDSIVWGNVTSDGETANYDTRTWWDCDEDGNEVEYASVQFAHSCTWPMPVDGESAGVIDGDPRLVDAVNGDLRLRVGSSCIVEGVQTMGVNLGDPVAGHVISVRVEGHGSVSPMTAVLSEGETATFEVSDSTRPFLGFATNGVLATASDVLLWPNVSADGTVTATFSNFTFHVDAELGDDANDGLSWATAKASIQSAIDEAVRGETIYVKAGTYEPIVVGGAMSLRIESVDGKEATVIDGGGTALCVSMSWMKSRSSTLVGFTLTNGYSTYGGGAYGGVLEDCLIVGNTAKYSGGGLYNSTARRCTISQNTVSSQGGSGHGGGASHCSLINCLVADNVVDADDGLGGGASSSSLYNCTVVGNMVYGTDRAYGGGVYFTKLYNTIVFGNSLVAEDEDADTSGENAYEVWDIKKSRVGEDPGFADAENGDYRLSAGSPCLDAGSNGYVMDDLDLDGNARIQHFTVDIGCYEYELTTPEHDADADFAAQMAGTCYGVFVGVNQYTYASSLTGCNLDATNMQTRCVKGYWHQTNTVAMLDAAATKSAVRARLTALAAKAVSGDTVLYYQSSHGGNHTSGGEYTKDAYICLYDSGYEDYEMAEDLMQFASGVKVVIVLDTCHSAGMFKSVGAAACSGSSFAVRVREIMAARQAAKGVKSGIAADDIGWIAAADYDEYSYDSSQGGAFTVAMLSGWASGAADHDGDGRLNFHELWRYAREIATGYGDTLAQCLNEDVLLSRFAGKPDSPDTGEATATTPVPVEHAWLDSYPEILASVGGDYEAMANAQSPGRSGGGKVWPDGTAYYVWQDFVAGTDPTDENSVFTAKIEIVDGEPVVTWEPDTPELRATRVYRKLGKKTLMDKDWADVTDEDLSAYRFFKVTVDLP